MKKYLILTLITFLILINSHIQVSAAEGESPYKKLFTKSQGTENTKDTETEQSYSLFRSHSEQYYPVRSTRKASILSATMPGLGQAYADNYLKAALFLTAEIGVFSLASYNIARALHYRNHNEFNTGFYDERTNNFLDRNQIESRIADHSIRGTLFLITGIGLHVWNILDAPKTADAYNKRRISVHMQLTNSGKRTLLFSHQF